MYYIKKVGVWLLVNAILPIVLPVIIIRFGEFFSSDLVDSKLEDKFDFLIKDGFYIFSACTLVFSLVEDFFKRCSFSKLDMVLCVVLTICFILTAIFFWQSYSDPEKVFIQEHRILFFSVWIVTALFSTFTKVIMEVNKKNI